MNFWKKIRQRWKSTKNHQKTLEPEKNENYESIIDQKEYHLPNNENKWDFSPEKKLQTNLLHSYDQEYYNKLLKKKLIEKSLLMERIIKKWEKNGNIAKN